RVEVGLVDLEGLEEEMAGDVGARRAARLEDERRHVLAGEAHEEIREHQRALVAHPLILVQRREGAPARRAGFREGVGAVPMRDAAQPVETAAAALAERRHERAELRVHAPAVIALVVVLAEHLPVRAHLVADRVTDPKLAQGEWAERFGHGPDRAPDGPAVPGLRSTN